MPAQAGIHAAFVSWCPRLCSRAPMVRRFYRQRDTLTFNDDQVDSFGYCFVSDELNKPGLKVQHCTRTTTTNLDP
jgi:hypothetical protein